MVRDLEIRLKKVTNDLQERITALEKKISKIPDPFILYYKKPGETEYFKINEVLDTLFDKIEKLEKK